MLFDMLTWVNNRIPKIGKRDPKEEIRLSRRAFNEFIAGQIVFGLAITAVAVIALNTASNVAQISVDVEVQAATNTKALCALRQDLQVRVRQANKFLDDHPEGAFGIPAATIRQQVDGQQRTIDALSVIKCPRSNRRVVRRAWTPPPPTR